LLIVKQSNSQQYTRNYMSYNYIIKKHFDKTPNQNCFLTS